MKLLHKVIFALVIIVLTCESCSETNNQYKLTYPIDLDLAEIVERGKLVAVAEYNSTGYFVKRGRQLGYQFELLKNLAQHLGVELEIKVESDVEKMITMLNEGECDIIASNLTVTKQGAAQLAYTEHHSVVRQVLIQRKPEGWKKMRASEVELTLIRNPLVLSGKTVYVCRGSSHYKRLMNLSEEIGGEITVIQDEADVEAEGLVRKVANGEIEYAVANEDIAMVVANKYPDLDIKTAVSFPQKIAWGVRKNSPALLQQVNSWLLGMKKKREYYALYDKYFKGFSSYRKMLSMDYFSIKDGKLSPYDNLIKQNAKKLNWDWRLLASLIFQESGFNQYAHSNKGALGLMQLMPETAAFFGATDIFDPAQNIKAGTAYLLFLEKFWKKRIEDPNERLKFVLASYNAGQGHVLDACRLAAKYEMNSKTWDSNVAHFMLQKSNPEYYKDPVVKLGFCRGKEPVSFVSNIQTRYEVFEKLLPEKGDILAEDVVSGGSAKVILD